jgi:ketosteroid isomerase-like protein
MAGARIGKQRAVFPAGYVSRNPLYRLGFYPALSFRPYRRAALALPRSRFRTLLMAHGMRIFYEDVSRGGFDRYLPVLDPNMEFALFFGLGSFRGPRGAGQAVSAWLESFPGGRFELEEFVDAGGDEFVAIVRFRGRGRSSGVELDQRAAQVGTIERGNLVRVRSFSTAEEALAAAGVT